LNFKPELFELRDRRPSAIEVGVPKRPKISMLVSVSCSHDRLGVVLPPVVDENNIAGRPEPVPTKERVTAELVEFGNGGKDGVATGQRLERHRQTKLRDGHDKSNPLDDEGHLSVAFEVSVGLPVGALSSSLRSGRPR
jgi:hypothetical protein